MRLCFGHALASFAIVALPASIGCQVITGLERFKIGDGGGAGAGGTGGAGGTTTTIETGCIPNQSSMQVRSDCGVFVSSSMGNDASDGSQTAPLATITKAMSSSKSGPIYLCAESFSEAVRVTANKTIYGALDCTAGWVYASAKKSEVSAAAGAVPLVVDPGVSLDVEDVAFRAKDAVDAGGSSIAIIATKDAEVSLTRCNVEAGNARDGAAGEAFAMGASAGAMGNAGMNACTATSVNGGSFAKNACDDADLNDDSLGGKGGSGDDVSGGAGSPGQPDGAMNGGAGEGAMVCTNGGPGDGGTPGMSGAGAQGTGTISAQGYAGMAGSPGEKGKPGQGGGGGGGAKGGTGANKCADMTKAGGASGGSGGSGGCGGKGGNGGQAGGASIAVVSLGAKLTFNESVTLTAKAGGKGGSGGTGQNGGMGGPGGSGGSKGAASSLKDGCSGGPGGAGGAGGMGGGGLGGHSIAIAYMGTKPATTSVTLKFGAAGDGGAGDGATGNGAAGIAKEVQAF